MSTPDSGTIDTQTAKLTKADIEKSPGNENLSIHDKTELERAEVDGESAESDKLENNATSQDFSTGTEEQGVTSDNDTNLNENQNGQGDPSEKDIATEGPPLPEEPLPPLLNEQPPVVAQEDDATQWDNPRVPEVPQPGPPGVPATKSAVVPTEIDPTSRPAGGYDPAIHGDYDSNAWYAQPSAVEEPTAVGLDPAAAYAATGQFNRFTGRWQAAEINPENFNDENKSKRQMNAFFDVDAAANNHDGRSLKEERSGKKLSKAELKQFKEKRKQKKEEKRRAWLRD
ncbi:hypothetical protein BPOR_0884g00030 [Botrytis porri]|uniref:Uncharacterized protein n=1 Tax=Botrytis porri TaxID=87229 RepID=A0A4Z1K9Y3_9HELO|nr:hypothetical protein BPOR_0884g00030 [Botrytis porri]